jgi:mycoredoxin
VIPDTAIREERSNKGARGEMTEDPAPVSPEADDPERLEVFWRPGCPFCYRLLHALEHAGVRFHLRNIWEDDAARQLVAAINHGNETVPTVVLGQMTATNPSPKAFIKELREQHAELFEEEAASAG